MAKHKKMTTLQKTIAKLQREQDETKRQREEAFGVSADGTAVKKRLVNYKNLMLIKLVMACLLPLVYFIFSPLLFPLVLLYALLYFPARKIEKKANKGLRKDLWISVPRLDSIIAAGLVVIVLFGLIMTVSTTAAKEPGIFEGKTKTQVVSIVNSSYGLDLPKAKSAADTLEKSGMTMSRGKKYLIQGSTMFTGEWIFFQPVNRAVVGYGKMVKNNQGGGSGGGTMVIKGQDGEEHRIENINVSAVSPNEFVTVFVQITVVLNSMILIGIAGAGIWIFLRMKTLGDKLGLKLFEKKEEST